jgi:hypothetical protein
LGYFDRDHYNSSSCDKRRYNSCIPRSAIITSHLLRPCHYLRLPRTRTHRQVRICTATHTDIKFRLLRQTEPPVARVQAAADERHRSASPRVPHRVRRRRIAAEARRSDRRPLRHQSPSTNSRCRSRRQTR